MGIGPASDYRYQNPYGMPEGPFGYRERVTTDPKTGAMKVIREADPGGMKAQMQYPDPPKKKPQHNPNRKLLLLENP
jgi:hypothetical protein